MSGFGSNGAHVAPVIEGWEHIRTGKVRDLYRNADGEILLVASDRISAFDWVLPSEIPNKGAILTQLSLFWFELLGDIVPNHIITEDVPKSVMDRVAEPCRVEPSCHQNHLMQVLKLHKKVLRLQDLEYRRRDLRRKSRASIQLRLFLQKDLPLGQRGVWLAWYR